MKPVVGQPRRRGAGALAEAPVGNGHEAVDTVDAVEQGIDAAFRLALGALLAMLALIVLLLAWHQPEPVAPIAATPDEYGWQI